MSVDAIMSALEPVREQFVSGFDAWITDMLAEFPGGAPEHAFELKDQKGVMRNLYRVDFAIQLGDTPEIREMQLNQMLGFSPWTGPVGGIQLELSPFRWNSAVVLLDNARWNNDLVQPWFDSWFGVVDGKPAAAMRNRSAGLIHAASIDGPGLHVDLGSLPSRALAELVPLAEQHGASKVSILDASKFSQRGTPS